MLIQHRSSVNFAQVVTWNDYGESHYIGPIEGAQPNSQAWVNGFDHQGDSSVFLVSYRVSKGVCILKAGWISTITTVSPSKLEYIPA